MNTLSSIFQAQKEYLELREKAEYLRTKQKCVTSEKYNFCLHLHYDNPWVSAWIKENASSRALFELKEEGLITLIDSGDYELDTITEMIDLISNWLGEEI